MRSSMVKSSRPEDVRRFEGRPLRYGFLKSISGPDGKSGLFVFPALFFAASAFFYYFYGRNAVTVTDRKVGVVLPFAAAPLEPMELAAPPAQAPPEPSLSAAWKYEEEAYRLMKEGGYGKAVILLRAALKDSPDSYRVKTNLAISLNALGLDEAARGNLNMARELFSEAAGLSGEKPVIENLAAVEIRLKDLASAANTLEPLSSDPRIKGTLTGLYTELGDRSRRDGDVSAAAGYYGKGLAHDPSNGYLRGMVRKLTAEREVEERMDSSSVGHFTVKYEGGENTVTGYLIGLLLEEAYIKVGADLGFYPSDKIEALLYTKETFRDVTRSPSWTGAIFDGRIKVPAGGINEKSAELEKVIFHEYTHALVHRLGGGRVPVWLNEGIAQYEEGRNTSGQSDLIKEIAGSNRVNLRVFERSFMGLNAAGARVAYLISLSATEYIIKEYGLSSLRRIFDGLNSGMTMDSAVSSALYISYDDLESGWLNSLKR